MDAVKEGYIREALEEALGKIASVQADAPVSGPAYTDWCVGMPMDGAAGSPVNVLATFSTKGEAEKFLRVGYRGKPRVKVYRREYCEMA